MNSVFNENLLLNKYDVLVDGTHLIIVEQYQNVIEYYGMAISNSADIDSFGSIKPPTYEEYTITALWSTANFTGIAFNFSETPFANIIVTRLDTGVSVSFAKDKTYYTSSDILFTQTDDGKTIPLIIETT